MEELIGISKPEELIIWNGMADTGIHLAKEDAALLLGYLEGHDYQLGVNKSTLYRIDVSEPEECIPYSIDEVIDLVCEWNYEMIEDNEKRYNEAEEQEELSLHQEALEKLRQDEPKLDALFSKTRFGRQVTDIAKQMIVEAGGEIPDYMKVSETSKYEEEKRKEEKNKAEEKENEGR